MNKIEERDMRKYIELNKKDNFITELHEELIRERQIINEKIKEIERLNNIIKRLEEFIEREIEIYTLELTEKNTNALSYSLPIKAVYKEIYNVLQKLKGDGSND